MKLQALNVAARSEVTDEIYEPPVLVEVGDFTELTRGFILFPLNDGRPAPFNARPRD